MLCRPTMVPKATSIDDAENKVFKGTDLGLFVEIRFKVPFHRVPK